MLIIAEKPNVAKEFADALSCRKTGGIYSGKDTTITNCKGHLFNLEEPKHYTSEIFPIIPERFDYTTNSIENFNRQLRKVTKSKTIFPTDDALFKMLYLAMMDATKKWTGKAWDWGLTLDQLCIYFGDRIQPEDID